MKLKTLTLYTALSFGALFSGKAAGKPAISILEKNRMEKISPPDTSSATLTQKEAMKLKGRLDSALYAAKSKVQQEKSDSARMPVSNALANRQMILANIKRSMVDSSKAKGKDAKVDSLLKDFRQVLSEPAYRLAGKAISLEPITAALHAYFAASELCYKSGLYKEGIILLNTLLADSAYVPASREPAFVNLSVFYISVGNTAPTAEGRIAQCNKAIECLNRAISLHKVNDAEMGDLDKRMYTVLTDEASCYLDKARKAQEKDPRSGLIGSYTAKAQSALDKSKKYREGSAKLQKNAADTGTGQ